MMIGFWSLIFLVAPFLLQGFAMAVDEFYFHLRRGLPSWERVGHPLDTLSAFVCLLLTALTEPSTALLALYTAMAIVSCLLITKDEWVHTELCSAGENWIHSLLFVLHPICLIAAAVIWKGALAPIVLQAQTVLLVIFMVYQITYWNFIWKPKSTPPSTIN